MKTKYYVLIGVLMLLFVLVVANVTHADQDVSDDIVAASPAWYNGASIVAPLGNAIDDINPSVVVRISIPVERGSPYSQNSTINCYSDSGYSSSISCDGAGGANSYSDTSSVTADGSMQSVTFGFTGTIVNGVYVSLNVGSDGGNVYGSCVAGTNLGGTNRSCSPTTDGVPYYTGIGTPPVPPPTNNTTRIISTIPANNVATTSPVALSMQYYVDASSSIDTTEVSLYRLESGNSLAFHATGTAATGTITTWSASSSASLPDGLYSAFWSLTSSSSILFNISTSTSFVVGTSTWQQLLNLGSSTAATTAATSSCSIFDVGCNVIAALTWAFVPSQISLQLLAQASNALYTAPPVGYLKAYQDTVRIAFSTTTPDSVGFSGDAIDVIGAVYGTSSVRTGLVAGYWASFTIFFYAGTIALIHAVL